MRTDGIVYQSKVVFKQAKFEHLIIKSGASEADFDATINDYTNKGYVTDNVRQVFNFVDDVSKDLGVTHTSSKQSIATCLKKDGQRLALTIIFENQ